MNEFLPISMEDMRKRGWDACDFIIISGDAYVDHPSFGHALIARLLESKGYRVGIIAQPDWKSPADFKRLGRPRLGFLIASGNIDSMVNHYTASKKPRSSDAYSPGGKSGLRPDRATVVYTNRAREAYKNIFIAIGGVEASLRRFAHYDYWDNKVRRSILVDSNANVLLYGMAEKSITELAKRLSSGQSIEGIAGTCILSEEPAKDGIVLPSYQDVCADTRTYIQAFLDQYREQDPIRGRTLSQPHEKNVLVQYPPSPPLTTSEMDAVYELPYVRQWHPVYDALGGIPALEEVKFSITNTRGCFGACSFCALTFHQGRMIQSRSTKSVVKEAKFLTSYQDFKGYIHDIGGPTANFTRPACELQKTKGTCRERDCLSPHPCKNLIIDHKPFLKTLRAVRELPKIKKVFVRSGLRYDAVMLDSNDDFMRELCQFHISGQLKVAPEHVSQHTLRVMNKPGGGSYHKFVDKYEQTNRKYGLNQYLVPYFMSGHPGCELSDAVELAEYLRDIGHQPEQVQDFYPTPGTMSTTMYYTGINPLTNRPIYIPKSRKEKAMQRALLQYRRPKNHALVRTALTLCGREDLIGYDRKCLVPPERYTNRDEKRRKPIDRTHSPRQKRPSSRNRRR